MTSIYTVNGALVILLLLTCVVATADDAWMLREGFDCVDGRLPDPWHPVAGQWHVSDGALVVDATGGEASILLGDAAWQNYEVEVTATFRKVQDDSRWLSVLVRASADGARPWSQVPVRYKTTAKNGMEFAVRTTSDSWSVRQTAAAKEDSSIGRARRLRVVVRGSYVQGYLDGQLVIDSPYCVDRPRGCVGLGASGCEASFDDFLVRRLPDTPIPPERKPGLCDIVAHRGFSAVAPENTLAAIKEAVDAGASGCEFDVYGCGDGTVVLMHDKTVDRTTDGSGRVTELTLERLKQLDAGSWKHARYSGEPVPTLDEALRLLKDTGCQPVIEIKMEGISARVVEAVRKADMVDQAAVIAFSQEVVTEVRQLEPRLPCAWLCGDDLHGTPAERADWLAARARQCGTDLLDLNYKILSPNLIAELKSRGLSVWTWTVNDPPVMRSLIDWGIDSITTDRPDLLRKELESAEQ
jgi:glycerophosphoryl diester phosphodiesterase